MSASTTISKKTVRFAEQEVSAVHMVPRKTEEQARTLFYQPADEQRARQEVQIEKLTRAAAQSLSMMSKSGNQDHLNAMTALARNQFRYGSSCALQSRAPFPSMTRRGANNCKGCAGMA